MNNKDSAGKGVEMKYLKKSAAVFITLGGLGRNLGGLKHFLKGPSNASDQPRVQDLCDGTLTLLFGKHLHT